MKHQCTHYIPKFIWKTIVAASTCALAAMFTIHGLLHHSYHHDFINMFLTIFFIIVFAVISVSMFVSAVKDLLDLNFTIFKEPSMDEHQDQEQIENKQVEQV
ncbi:hypothetical protein QVD17_37004 [Tagetes erecta]|uniref:Uncharacterized protein n=1 Tax=Tagetes erecta TaxID=13708 RepID=A0AAD8JTR6_TARER|nr:hypothetical protein QVD17_37004 [Tagetes erecta]